MLTTNSTEDYTLLHGVMECGTTPFLKLFFCAGKLSDALYVPPFLQGEKVLIVCHRLTKNYSVVTKIIGYFQESHPG